MGYFTPGLHQFHADFTTLESQEGIGDFTHFTL